MENQQKTKTTIAVLVALATGYIGGDMLSEGKIIEKEVSAEVQMSLQERQALYEIINAEIEVAKKPLQVSGVITAEKILDAGYKLIAENKENKRKVDVGVLDDATYEAIRDYLINKEQAVRETLPVKE